MLNMETISIIIIFQFVRVLVHVENMETLKWQCIRPTIERSWARYPEEWKRSFLDRKCFQNNSFRLLEISYNIELVEQYFLNFRMSEKFNFLNSLTTCWSDFIIFIQLLEFDRRASHTFKFISYNLTLKLKPIL